MLVEKINSDDFWKSPGIQWLAHRIPQEMCVSKLAATFVQISSSDLASFPDQFHAFCFEMTDLGVNIKGAVYTHTLEMEHSGMYQTSL